MTDIPPIVYAVMAGDAGLVAARIAAGLDVNRVDPVRSTALNQAVYRNNLEIGRILLRSGADPRVRDQDGRDAFDCIRTFEWVSEFGLQDDPRFALIKPVVEKIVRLPAEDDPDATDRHGGPYDRTPRCIRVALGPQLRGSRVSVEGFHVVPHEAVAWSDGDLLVRRELTLLKATMPDERFQLLENRVLDIEVHLNAARTSAVVRRIIADGVDDPALQAVLDDEARERSVHSPVFGRLVYQRLYKTHEGEMTFAGFTVTVSVNGLPKDPIRGEVERMERFIGDEARHAHEIRRVWNDEVYRAYHDNWREDDEPSYPPESFADMLVIFAVTVHSDGDLDFACAGDDLFAGHFVTIRFSNTTDSYEMSLSG